MVAVARLKIGPNPALRVKVIPTLPTTIVAESPIIATRSNLTWDISFDVNALSASIDVLKPDLAAIEALSGQGFATRIGNGSWALRSIAGTANEITVTNGFGIAGNPVLSLPSNLAFTGKTIAGGTFSNPTITSPAVSGGSFTSPTITTPTGIVKNDIGLGNVDNTSDATKNSAVATLTNKTLPSPVITTPTGILKSDIGLANVDNTSDATKNAATVTLTNKTISGAANSLTNVGNSSLVNSSLTVAGKTISLGGSATLAAADLTNGTTGTGQIVLGTNPTFVSATITTATAGNLNVNNSNGNIAWSVPAADAGIDFGSGTTVKRASATGQLKFTSQNSVFEFVGDTYSYHSFVTAPNAVFTNNNNGTAPLLTNMAHGSATNPVTDGTHPTVGISRYEAHSVTNEIANNPALGIYLTSNNTSNVGSGINAQGNALYSKAIQLGSGDVVAGFFVSQNKGPTEPGGHTHTAYGMFSIAEFVTPTNNAIGAEIYASNQSGADYTYTGGFPLAWAIHVGGSDGSFGEPGKRITGGLWLSSPSSTTKMDVGIAFSTQSVVSTSIIDDSSSVTSYKTTGAHTYGIDLSSSTFSNAAFKSPGFVVGPSGQVDVTNATTATSTWNSGAHTGFIYASAAGSVIMGSATVTPFSILTGNVTRLSISSTAADIVIGTSGNQGTLSFFGATSGTTKLTPSAAASGVLTLPSATDTLVGRATTDTLTNKTLSSPAITTPTGIVKNDIGLGNVDNTSDATKNAATATLTNKTLTSPAISSATITTSTFNGNSWTSGTGTLAIGAGKTATLSNSLTFSGTDGSSVAFGAGGTVAYLASPTFTGTPAAPTATAGTNTTQIATTAFVTGAVAASTTGVSSFNGRTGAVVPVQGDYPTSLIPGTTTNNNATAGNIGEYVEGAVTSGSAVSLSTNVASTITSVTLTAGDWDVSGSLYFTATSSTVITYEISCISNTNNGIDLNNGRYSDYQAPGGSGTIAVTVPHNIVTPCVRLSLSSTTTIYLVAQASFTTSTLTGHGLLRARRVR